MDINDLSNFVVIADVENLQLAATTLDTTPSALSKSIKRLEAQLNTPLFDRPGKSIRLNDAGVMFLQSATRIVQEATQAKTMLSGLGGYNKIRLTGPSLALYKWASVIARQLHVNTLDSNDSCPILDIQDAFEDLALQRVIQGHAELAVVTEFAYQNVPQDKRATLTSQTLGVVRLRIAAGESHPLMKAQEGNKLLYSIEEVLQHPFVVPAQSPWCGERRGPGCDGWFSNQFVRKIGWQTDDYSILGQLIRSGLALGFLPDFQIRALGLHEIRINDNNKLYDEETLLLVSADPALLTLLSL